MKKYIIFLCIFFYFFLASVYVTYPLVLHLTDSVTDLGDSLLITWILNWDIHALTKNVLKIFDANIYFPYSNSLAFSDTFFTAAFIAFIPTLLLREPAVAFNVTILFSFTTLGFFTYVLVRFITKHHMGGVISGTLVAFSTYTLDKTVHLQVLGIEWIPLCLFFFLLYVKNRKFRFFFATCGMFILQVFNSFLPGYFLLLCFLFLIVCLRINLKSYFWHKQIILSLCITIIAIIIVASPYIVVSHTYKYVRDIRDAIHFANRPEYFFYAFGKTRLDTFLKTTFYRTPQALVYNGYLGMMLIVAGSLSIWRFIFNCRKKDHIALSFLLIAVSSFVISLGPAFQWGGHVIKSPFIIPLPYAVLYYVIPGMQGFRNSARWEMLTVFALSVFVGIIATEVLRGRSSLLKFLVTVGIYLGVLGEYSFPAHLQTIPTFSQFPPVYAYISSHKYEAMIELPIYNWNMAPYANKEFMRMYYSTRHFFPMVNGASGFSPPQWQKTVINIAETFPDTKTISWMKKNNIRYIILHEDDYSEMEDGKKHGMPFIGKHLKTVQSQLKNYPSIILVKHIASDYVYRLE